jgi:hypothetical protein
MAAKKNITLGSLRTLAIEGSGREIVLIESRPSVGLGMDMRLASRKITGFALSQEDQILHLAVFAKASQIKMGCPSLEWPCFQIVEVTVFE